MTAAELTQLLKRVFPPLKSRRRLAILVDVPLTKNEDNDPWRSRRRMAKEWLHILRTAKYRDLESVELYIFPNVGSNNADLPEGAYRINDDYDMESAQLGSSGNEMLFADIFASTDLFLAPTEFSATAPLKIAAKKYGFRAATMSGFAASMMPALRIDYSQVQMKVKWLKQILDRATSLQAIFHVQDKEYIMVFDLRFRSAHESSGVFTEAGTAGNLPSGEAYIVPYEGEKEPSITEGVLPVQFENEIVAYIIHENRAIGVVGTGPHGTLEARRLKDEPAYGNIAELGFGVLGEWGIKPVGEILLDEKLGFHVAFGRSDHFGGIIGPSAFSSSKAVVHIDRIYIPEVQPLIKIASIVCRFENGDELLLIQDGRYEFT